MEPNFEPRHARVPNARKRPSRTPQLQRRITAFAVVAVLAAWSLPTAYASDDENRPLNGTQIIDGAWIIPAGEAREFNGDLCIMAETIQIDGSLLGVQTGQRDAPNLYMAATDTITITGTITAPDGADAAPAAIGLPGGRGGSIMLAAPTITLDEAAFQVGSGGAGGVAKGVMDGVSQGGTGGAGGLLLIGGDFITSSTTASLAGAHAGPGAAPEPDTLEGITALIGGDSGASGDFGYAPYADSFHACEDTFGQSLQSSATTTNACDGDIDCPLYELMVAILSIFEGETGEYCNGSNGADANADGADATGTGTTGSSGSSGLVGGVGGTGGQGPNGGNGGTATAGNGQDGCWWGRGGNGGSASANGGTGGQGGQGGTGGAGTAAGGPGGLGGKGGRGGNGGTANGGRPGCGGVFGPPGQPGAAQAFGGVGGPPGSGGSGGAGLIPGAPGSPGAQGDSGSPGSANPGTSDCVE